MPKPLLLLPLLGLLAAGCSSPPPSLAPADMVFALADHGSIYLVHGDGSGPKQLIGGGWAQATLSPDKTKIACVQPGDFHITIFNLNAQYDLDGKPKTVYNADSLQAMGEFGTACSPLWSQDGNKIYFLNENHLVVYDYQEKHTSVLADFPEEQSGTELSHCFPKEGNNLYAFTHDRDNFVTLWSIDLSTNQAVSIESFNQAFYVTHRFPTPPPDDAYLTLYGSKENPVSEPVIPPGDRFYFYSDKKESTFESDRIIAGYDRTQNLKFEVLTVGTRFRLPGSGSGDYSE